MRWREDSAAVDGATSKIKLFAQNLERREEVTRVGDRAKSNKKKKQPTAASF